MSMFGIRYKAEPCRTVGFASISNVYITVGSALENPASQFFIQNLTDETVWFSLDGINDHFPLPANGFFLSDVVSNKSKGEGLFLSQGSRLFVKELSDTPTEGSVYFTVFYAAQD